MLYGSVLGLSLGGNLKIEVLKMWERISFLSVTLFGLICYSCIAQANIVGVSPGGSLIAPPGSVSPGSLESDSLVYAFDENIVTLTGSRNLDKVPTGTNTVQAGETVQSHFIHFDPVSDSSTTSDVVTFTFDNDVIGVFWSNGKLGRTDPGGIWEDLGLNGVMYSPVTNRRGLTGSDRSSLQFISPNQISLQLTAGGRDSYDQLRVITAAKIDIMPVPLPAAAWLFGSAILGMLSIRRKVGIEITS